MAATKQQAAAKTSVQLKILDDAPAYKWQMVFNAFTLEWLPNGCMLRVAYLQQGTTNEIIPILICNEGLEQLRLSAPEYIRDFGSVTPRPPDSFHNVRQFSPLFANHVRVARSGESAEVALFTVPLHHIASIAQGRVTGDMIVHPVQVALLHSDVLTHQQLVLGLLANQ